MQVLPGVVREDIRREMTCDPRVKPLLIAVLICAIAWIVLLPARAAEPQVVSRGEAFDVKRSLVPECPTVFLFRKSGEPVGEEILKRLIEKGEADGKTAVRVVETEGVDAPAARAAGVAQLPEAQVYDRRGTLVGKGGSWEAVEPHLAKALKTPRIKWIDTDDPEAAKVYGNPAMVADIGKTMSLRPELLKGIMRVANQAHFSDGFLDVKTKEIIASYVSALNECRY